MRDPNWRVQSQDGFGVVEVLVAMMMLAAIAIAFLPVLITGLKLSAGDSSVTTAAQVARTQIALARQTSTCSTFTAFANGSADAVTDGTGGTLTPVRTPAGPCPSSYPGTMSFTVTVNSANPVRALATATTLVYVGAS